MRKRTKKKDIRHFQSNSDGIIKQDTQTKKNRHTNFGHASAQWLQTLAAVVTQCEAPRTQKEGWTRGLRVDRHILSRFSRCKMECRGQGYRSRRGRVAIKQDGSESLGAGKRSWRKVWYALRRFGVCRKSISCWSNKMQVAVKKWQ